MPKLKKIKKGDIVYTSGVDDIIPQAIPIGKVIEKEENFFVEKMLGTDPIEPLSDEVMNEYRKPFINPGEDRRPTLDWPRQIPIDNEPIEVYNEVKDNLKFMMETNLPKFLIVGNPGRIMPKPLIEFCRKFKNQKEITVKGHHFLQEEAPDEISDGLKVWLSSI